MALTKTTVLSHDIRGEYKTINEIKDTFYLEDGTQVSHSRHRGGPVSPGALVDNLYVITNLSSKSQDIRDLATACWTPAVHSAYEAHLRA